jgi:hypothetical protein
MPAVGELVRCTDGRWMRWCQCYLRLRAPLMMPMTGKTNVRPVDDQAVTDRDKH